MEMRSVMQDGAKPLMTMVRNISLGSSKFHLDHSLKNPLAVVAYRCSSFNVAAKKCCVAF